MSQVVGDNEKVLALTHHAAWFRHRTAAGAGNVHQQGTTMLTACPVTNCIDLVMPPHADTTDVEQLLDLGIRLVREQEPLAQLGCWSADTNVSRDILGIILGRGLAWGWQPRWMSLPLSQDFTVAIPPDVSITTADKIYPPTIDGVPYADGLWHVRNGRTENTTVKCFLAIAGNNVVGAVTLCLHHHTKITRATIHDLGVAPTWRRKGVGRALTCTALHEAFDAGATSAELNSTPEGVLLYAAMGFRDIGVGQTWWLPDNAQLFIPTGEQERALVNAVARDDGAAVGALPRDSIQLGSQALTCQMTAMQLAARCHSTIAAHALQERGLPIDLLSASKLALHTEVAETIAALGPDLDRLNQQTGTTLLHDAVAESDVSLVRELLAAGASVEVRDQQHQLTPLQWLPYVDCPDLIGVFRAAGFDV